jgi:hypothetical protein
MTLSLRHRIVLTPAPLLALLTALGGAGVALLPQPGGRIERQNVHDSCGIPEFRC